MEHRRPKGWLARWTPRNRRPLSGYAALLNDLPADEAVLFGDAAHQLHAVRRAGCWGPKDIKSVQQTSGGTAWTSWCHRFGDRPDLHAGGGNGRHVSTITLLMAIAATYPRKRMIHLFLDNARYHHAKRVKAWLEQAGVPDQTTLCSRLLSPSQPDRTAMGADAQDHPQPMPRTIRRFSDAMLTSWRGGAQKLGRHCDTYRITSESSPQFSGF